MRVVSSRAFHYSLRRSLAVEKHPFRTWEEYRVLETLLTPHNSKAPAKLPYIEQMRKLRSVQEARSTLKVVRPAVEKDILAGPDPLDDRIIPLVRGPALSSKDIDAWLKINVLGGPWSPETLKALEHAIYRMIAHSSPNSLRAIMQYLAKYWEIGIYGQKPLVTTARKQARAVLKRALAVHAPTHYVQSYRQIVPQVGIPDLDKFDRFVASLHQYLDISQPPVPMVDDVSDLLIQLVARCGPVSMAQDRISALLVEGRHPSSDTIDEFLEALTKNFDIQRDMFEGTLAEFQNGVKGDLAAFRDLLVSHDATPAVIRFLLVWVSSLDDFYSVVEIAERSNRAADIFDHCQYDMLSVLAGLTAESRNGEDLRAMARCFGLLDRFESRSGVTVDTLDKFVLLVAKRGNAPGVLRVLEMRNAKTKDQALDSHIIADLLDAFPLPNFPGSSPEAANVLVAKLRPLVTPLILGKYVSALQRSGSTDVLKSEWSASRDKADTDAVIAFIAAFSSSDEPALALEVLTFALDTSGRVNVASAVSSSNLIDETVFYRTVAKSIRGGGWTIQEVEDVVGHIPGAVQVVQTGHEDDIDALWPPELAT